MVIHQFNKLIRNKWVWGVFAIAISAFFAFDFLLDDLRRDDKQATGAAGQLAGEAVDARVYGEIVEDIRGLGRNRNWKLNQADVNMQAWENYAVLRVAEKAGIEATDDEVRSVVGRDNAFHLPNGEFSQARYEAILREASLTPERYESACRRDITYKRVNGYLLGSAAWVSPMEFRQMLADLTDEYTVKVARFVQDKKDADAVTLDDAGLRKWYDANTNALALSDRMKIRFVKFDATDPKVLAKMSVSEESMRDRYDETIDLYTTTDTNDVSVTKPFEEVKGTIEKELRQIAAIEFFETNLNARAFDVKPANGASRLDEIAKEDGLKVETSDWFATDGSWQPGFMTRADQVLRGVEKFADAVSDLDPAMDDMRYAILVSDKAVWLVERAETSPAHVPTFDEAKEIIRPRALRDARRDAFKASVEAIAKKGASAVLATKDVSTNIVFTVRDLQPGQFQDQGAVSRSAMKLAKGEVSELVMTGVDRGIVVVCEDRKADDAVLLMQPSGDLAEQIRNSIAGLTLGQLSETWRKWNLERLGFTPGRISSVEKTETEE